ncbi:polysaccharide deacetylase family protein [Draconibacterium sp.]|nr:polysaccharide deacetylase family protein [Draconibacterium sp.]
MRINPDEKEIYLVFTADSTFEGGDHVLNVLNQYNIKGSFFFTGNFLRLKNKKSIIEKIVQLGHYVGAHSNKHLLYCDWEKRDSTLISYVEFENDLKNNFHELEKFGISFDDARFFIPPYEWYNQQTNDWSRKLGLEVINFTSGTGTNADYTTPEMKNYKSSEEIFSNLKQFEKENGLNGAIILIHPGTEPERTDKFYNKLDELIEYFKNLGYQFKSINTCL